MNPCHALLAAACALAMAAAPARAKPVEQVRVGFSTSISGPFAALGAEARDGFNLALKQLGGKLGGIPVEVSRPTRRATPTPLASTSTAISSATASTSIPDRSGRTLRLAVGPTLFAAKVPYLSSNTGPSDYSGAKCNPYFFGASYPNDAYHEAAGKFASDKGFKKVALIAPSYPGGKDAINGFKRNFKGTVGDELYTKLGQLDYSAELAQIAPGARCALHLPARWHGDQLHQAVCRCRTVDHDADHRAGIFGRRGHHPRDRRADARDVQHRALEPRLFQCREPGVRACLRQGICPAAVDLCRAGVRHSDDDEWPCAT
jgi:hypothetical protein